MDEILLKQMGHYMGVVGAITFFIPGYLKICLFFLALCVILYVASEAWSFFEGID